MSEYKAYAIRTDGPAQNAVVIGFTQPIAALAFVEGLKDEGWIAVSPIPEPKPKRKRPTRKVVRKTARKTTRQ